MAKRRSRNRRGTPRLTKDGRERIPIWNELRVIMGYVIGDTLYRRLHGHHFYREIPGITYGWAAMRSAMNAGATKLWVENKDTGTIYRSTVELFWQKGLEYGQINHGLGPHYCLPYEFWEVEEPVKQQMELALT